MKLANTSMNFSFELTEENPIYEPKIQFIKVFFSKIRICLFCSKNIKECV